ncbi:hypothetical protein [Paractinoplanes lichenicola]|uniref:Uncharacterized protein n=1 Tax=Paractinoplanes lichenicola TaxID=2802976 RepID=A0ABS1VF06_9ACTN|nr:hypothetical protein [Actinoplanes lichenicola]MBL7253254.1 hypothetical protein [Actinoplanes lichenicola]
MATLRAPGASLTLDGGALRDLRIHGHRVLDAITVAARDASWGTFPASVDASVDGSAAALSGTHGDVFAWSGRVSVAPGEIRFTMRGRVLRDFDSRRVGVCLLHPLSLAGVDFHTDTGPGVFGMAINPGTPASGFRRLQYDVGCPVEILLEGPAFEMEDHRNWSDPGWKSYCPPLSDPQPLRRHAGEEVVQAVTIRARPSLVPVISLVGRGAVRLSLTGHSASSLSHAHIPPAPAGHDPTSRGPGGSTQLLPAPAGHDPVSVALIGRGPDELAAGARVLAGRPGLRRVAVFDPETHTTAPGSVELVRSVLREHGCAAAVGGGSRAHLAELNRLDEIGDWDFCTFPITAQAHHSDDASILATARAMPAMIATARRILPGRPIVVGPLAFRRRVDANCPATPDDPPDDRETEPLGATYLLGALLGLRGAEALEVLLATDGPSNARPAPAEAPPSPHRPRGVSNTGLVVTASPGAALSSYGMTSPGVLLARLGALRGRPFVDLPTGHPDVLAATVLGGPVPMTLVANLGREPFEILGHVVAGHGHLVVEQE